MTSRESQEQLEQFGGDKSCSQPDWDFCFLSAIGCPEFPLFRVDKIQLEEFCLNISRAEIQNFRFLSPFLTNGDTFIVPVVIKEGGIWTKEGLV